VLVGQKDGSAEFGSVGRAAGAKTHALTSAQNGAHTHSFDTESSTGIFNGGWGGANPLRAASNSYTTAWGTTSSGSGSPHNNIQPSRAVLWAIKF
jgi:microcystin-dependent protein